MGTEGEDIANLAQISSFHMLPGQVPPGDGDRLR